jgi:endonuclease/exonuclease/phosphatase family metal-dependent hydrolase
MRLSVLQWNVLYSENINNTIDFLRQNPVDIICLQELTIDDNSGEPGHKPDYIARQLGYHHFYKDLPIESTEGKQLTLVDGIFSRYPLSRSDFYWINEPQGRGGYDDEFRAYIEITVEVGGKEITIGTTHMSYTDRFQLTTGKQLETDRLVDIIRAKKGSYILTGDLNAVPGSYTIEQISKHLAHAGPDMAQKTWTTKPFSYRGFEENDLNWRLDYIFTTKDIKINSAEILTTEYSDHLPLLAQIELP